MLLVFVDVPNGCSNFNPLLVVVVAVWGMLHHRSWDLALVLVAVVVVVDELA
jgi:hypothetical protein